MKTILFFQSTTRKSWIQKLTGVHRFAQEHDWFVQVVERFATASDIRRMLSMWTPAGCLVDRASSGGRAPDAFFRGIPAVYLDQNPEFPSSEHPCLLHDSAACAALAAEELVRCDCRSYAYLGLERKVHWDRPRQNSIKTAAEAAGRPFSVLRRNTLKDDLRRLPKPCGILGANDYCAMEACHAVVTLGLSIPEDVRIAGIDNDENYCETIPPGLTSVEPAFEMAGLHLCEMLAEEMEGAGNVRTEHYGPLRIVRRGSTNAMPGIDAKVRHALEHIRRHACEGSLSIDAVASAMGCSRSLATSLFRKETGRSILDEIHDQRFQKMCELLTHGNLPISMVVQLSGYESDGFAKRLFRGRAGMTMREYRNQSGTPAVPQRNRVT